MSTIPKVECPRCKKLHPQTLYSEEHGLCVYCRADDAERIAPNPAPTPQEEAPKAEAA